MPWREINPEEVKQGMEVFYFKSPKDSIPHMKTTVKDITEDRYRFYLLVDGIDDWTPLFYFKTAATGNGE